MAPRLIYSPIIDPTKLLKEVCKETQHNSLFIHALLEDSEFQILQLKFGDGIVKSE
jgi:hypothetical protein